MTRKRISAALGFGAMALSWAAACASAAALQSARTSLVGDKSHARLVSAGGLRRGRYQTGLDITLAPGVLTYWRNPGDAGVPPQFDFTGSQNVAAAAVEFPAPTRIEEAGTTTFGYLHEVLFPIMVTPRAPAEPVRLMVTLNYATCDTICVPAQTRQTLTLSPADPSLADATRSIAAWAARTPKPLPTTLAPKVERLRAGAAPAWRVGFPDAAGKTDLFVEGPRDWYFDSKPFGPGAFEVSLAQRPDGVDAATVPATLTYVDGDHAYETRVSLDLRGR